MTPKQKAEELVYRFYSILDHNLNKAKQCALIAVNEIIEAFEDVIGTPSYWIKVKKEIEKL